MNENWFLSELGRRIRRHRERRGFSLSELAERSELSRRYMTETEAGRANPSIIKLAGIARALKVGLAEICDLPLKEHRGRRIALIGLDSEFHLLIGRKLAFALDRPLVDLERRIKGDRGLQVLAMAGQPTEDRLAQLERELLEEYLVRDGESILVTGPYLLRRPPTWERLLESCFTVWVRVTVDLHWDHMMAQGHNLDRPDEPRTKAQLRQILMGREAAYSRAHLTVEPKDYDVNVIVQEIMDAIL